MRKISILFLAGALLFLAGCIDHKAVDSLSQQIEDYKVQLDTAQKEKQSLSDQLSASGDVIETLNAQIQTLEEDNKAFSAEKEDLVQKVTTLEAELNIQNEAALKALDAIEAQNKKIMALKADSALKTIVGTYAEDMKPSVADYFSDCLYQAVHREGVDTLIALIEKKSFDEIDGIVGSFADALAKTADLSYKTQLMMNAQSLDGTQSPTTLYFYARVLFFLSRWTG